MKLGWRKRIGWWLIGIGLRLVVVVNNDTRRELFRMMRQAVSPGYTELAWLLVARDSGIITNDRVLEVLDERERKSRG